VLLHRERASACGLVPHALRRERWKRTGAVPTSGEGVDWRRAGRDERAERLDPAPMRGRDAGGGVKTGTPLTAGWKKLRARNGMRSDPERGSCRHGAVTLLDPQPGSGHARRWARPMMILGQFGAQTPQDYGDRHSEEPKNAGPQDRLPGEPPGLDLNSPPAADRSRRSDKHREWTSGWQFVESFLFCLWEGGTRGIDHPSRGKVV
jgi:hypothetical protein